MQRCAQSSSTHFLASGRLCGGFGSISPSLERLTMLAWLSTDDSLRHCSQAMVHFQLQRHKEEMWQLCSSRSSSLNNCCKSVRARVLMAFFQQDFQTTHTALGAKMLWTWCSMSQGGLALEWVESCAKTSSRCLGIFAEASIVTRQLTQHSRCWALTISTCLSWRSICLKNIARRLTM